MHQSRLRVFLRSWTGFATTSGFVSQEARSVARSVTGSRTRTVTPAHGKGITGTERQLVGRPLGCSAHRRMRPWPGCRRAAPSPATSWLLQLQHRRDEDVWGARARVGVNSDGVRVSVGGGCGSGTAVGQRVRVSMGTHTEARDGARCSLVPAVGLRGQLLPTPRCWRETEARGSRHRVVPPKPEG